MAAVLAFVLVSVSATALASEKSEQGLNLAQEMTENASPAVRAAALVTLGHAGSTADRALLDEFKTADGPEERISAGVGLILAGNREGVSFTAEQVREARGTYEVLRDISAILTEAQMRTLVQAALADATGEQRRDIFRFLGGRSGDLYGILAEQMASNDEEVRTAARQALLHSARGESLSVANALASNRDEEIRKQVLAITNALKDRRDIRSDIIEVLEARLGDSSGEIQQDAARQLVALGEEGGANFLIQSLAEADGAKRISTGEFLLGHDIRADLSSLRPLIDDLEADPEDTDRQKEREVLYELAATSRDGDFFDDLVQKFNGDIAEDRLVAARSLGRMGNDDAVALLQRGLFEGQSVVRHHSARGLGHLGNADALGQLRRSVTNERDKAVRLESIKAIGGIRDVRSVQVLRFLVTDNDSEIKLAVVDALNAIGLPESAQGLEILVRDRDREVQWRAFLALLRIKPETAQRHLTTVLRNPPDSFARDLNPFELTSSARTAIYKSLLTHSGSRVRTAAVEHVNAHREVLLPVAREMVISKEINEETRRALVLVLVSEVQNEDLARLDRVMREYGEEASGQIAGWTLARNASSNFEASFRGFLSRDDSVMKAISAFALTMMD